MNGGLLTHTVLNPTIISSYEITWHLVAVKSSFFTFLSLNINQRILFFSKSMAILIYL